MPVLDMCLSLCNKCIYVCGEDVHVRTADCTLFAEFVKSVLLVVSNQSWRAGNSRRYHKQFYPDSKHKQPPAPTHSGRLVRR